MYISLYARQKSVPKCTSHFISNKKAQIVHSTLYQIRKHKVYIALIKKKIGNKEPTKSTDHSIQNKKTQCTQHLYKKTQSVHSTFYT